ncbi:hypothetical protein [Novosphingobium soli]|uniref:Uncharacterized protein n=1 Tax=Novosphingobium soli TaxID=574956 RepID=A0ABV6CYP8_9SPHN
MLEMGASARAASERTEALLLPHVQQASITASISRSLVEIPGPSCVLRVRGIAFRDGAARGLRQVGLCSQFRSLFQGIRNVTKVRYKRHSMYIQPF